MITVNGKEIQFETFPNGETRVVASSFPEEGYVIQEVGFKYESDADLIRLMMVKEYIRQRGYGDYGNLLIYYMPYSRMDRSEGGSPFTLKYVANFINSLKFRSVRIIEPHSDVTPALIDNSKSLYINFDLIEKVKQEVSFNDDKDFIVFPDAGASKRYSKMKAKNTLFCNKVRDFETGEIKGLDIVGDTSKAYGKTAIIVDDLSSYGGTFVHTANRLREEGFVEVILLVAHAENSIFKGKLFDHVDKVFTTDSILTEQNNWENAKFKDRLKVFEIEKVVDKC
jgi:ribose-phosphate pyrophosphokinase